MRVMARVGKRSLAGLSVILIFAAAGIFLWPRSSSNQPVSPPEHDAVMAAKPIGLASGIYILGRTRTGAVYAVETSEGLVLIDSGLDANATTVRRELVELHLDVNRLRAILLTHCHADHSMGAECLRKITGAKVYAGRADCPPLRTGGPREAFVSIFHMPSTVLHPTTVDVELGDNDLIAMGDTQFTAIAAPGHTPGSTCYLMERAGQRALFAGDVILSLSPENPEPLGTYPAYLAPIYGGSAGDFLTTMKKLRAMPMPDLVLPGHPVMDPTPQSPRLTHQRWEELLDTGIRIMDQLLAHRKADGANFLDGAPKQLLPGLHYLGDIKEHAVYCLKSSRGLILFDAPGGDELVEFLAGKFKDLGWDLESIETVLLTSADEEATSGLASLFARTGCHVVAPKAGLDMVRSVCPHSAEISTEADLDKVGWLDATVIPLRGRGVAPIAYLIHCEKKSVLISGRIPTKLSVPAMQELVRHMAGSYGDRIDYLKTLKQLRQIRPDLWLPAVPIHGQNANLYGLDWNNIIESLEQLLSG
jgi:glyoxylase-like metal-dependent hydrolase (beta-lactamase superfamily II)